MKSSEGESVQERFRRRWQEGPSERALAVLSESSRWVWRTREEFYQNASGLASRLREQGLGEREVCVIVLPSNELSASLFVSVLLVGAVPLFVAPPMLQANRVHSRLEENLFEVIRKVEPRLLIMAEGLGDLVNKIQRRHAALKILNGALEWASDDAKLAFSESPVNRRFEADIFAMQLTSGTTGTPKICVWNQGNALAGIDGMIQAMEVTGEDVFFNWTPLYHDMGLMVNFVLCLTSGIPLVLLEPETVIKSPATWIRGLSETGATITWSPNFGYALCTQRIADEELLGIDLSRVRGFWNAAERVHKETFDEFYRRFSKFGVERKSLKTNFGCAENIGGATFTRHDEWAPVEFLERAKFQERGVAEVLGSLNHSDDAITVVGVGRPYPGMELKIFSSDGQEMPDGEVGKIGMRSPSRMAGYLGEEGPGATGGQEDWLFTEDLGYLRGGELFWVGRSQERINIRGIKLDPSDFESVLHGVEGVRKGCFAAFGVPDATDGTERLVIVFELQSCGLRSGTEIEREIRRRILAETGVQPSELVGVPAGLLAKTSSGKRRHGFVKGLYLSGKLEAWMVNGDRSLA